MMISKSRPCAIPGCTIRIRAGTPPAAKLCHRHRLAREEARGHNARSSVVTGSHILEAEVHLRERMAATVRRVPVEEHMRWLASQGRKA